MKTKTLITCLAAVCLVMTGFTDAQAQDRRGTAGAQQLLLPMTAQSAALGAGLTAGLGNVNGLEGLNSNPALLVSNPGTNVMFSRMNYVADIGVNYFGVAQNIGANNIALTLSALSSGDVPRQTELSPEKTDVTWDASFVTFGAAYAREFTDRISAGIHAKFVSERIDNMSSNNVVFDAGLSYVVPEVGVRFGVSLKNFGFATRYDGTGLVRNVPLPSQNANASQSAVALDGADYEMPSLLNFGVTYTRPLGAAAEVSLLGNFRSNSFSPDAYAGGLEFGLMDLLFVRGGYAFRGDAESSDWAGWSIGGGLNLDVAGTNLLVDYAYRPMELLGQVHFITAAATL